MSWQFGLGLVVAGFLTVGIAWLRGSEPAVEVSSLSPEYQDLLREELAAYGESEVPLPKLQEMLFAAANRQRAEREAVEARAAKREAERTAWLENEVTRRTEAYRRRIPNELQVIIKEKIEAEARATAETKAGIPKLKSTISKLTSENAKLRHIIQEGKAQVEVAQRATSTQPKLQARIEQLSSENAELRDLVGQANAQAEAFAAEARAARKWQGKTDRLAGENTKLRQQLEELTQALSEAEARTASSELFAHVAQLESENIELKVQLDELCRQKNQLLEMLEQAATEPTARRSMPPISGIY